VVRFIADEMLGTVAKWLRILGFDTEYAREMKDEEILITAEREGRVILSRDKDLCSTAIKNGLECIFLESANLEKDLEMVLSSYPPTPEKFMSRCTICNSKLVEVEKSEVKGRVPEGVYKRQDRFWYCPKCHKYYWEGSHWEKMRGFLNKICE